MLLAQLASGYAFPNALLQHAIEDLEKLSIDVAALQRRRDRLVPALRELGYETTMPEGTFYVMARSPIDDDVAFAELLAEEGVLVLPGTVVEVPGWFRISLTATDEMVERGLGGFARARERALATAGSNRRLGAYRAGRDDRQPQHELVRVPSRESPAERLLEPPPLGPIERLVRVGLVELGDERDVAVDVERVLEERRGSRSTSR